MKSPIAVTQDFYARRVHQPKFSLWLVLPASIFMGLIAGLPFGWFFLVVAPVAFILIFVVLSLLVAARSSLLRKIFGLSSHAYSRLPVEKRSLLIFRRAKRELDRQRFGDEEGPDKDETA
jgi:hypothetical protein